MAMAIAEGSVKEVRLKVCQRNHHPTASGQSKAIGSYGGMARLLWEQLFRWHAPGV